ncbi:MAG: DUF4278 domain-containing protein [Parvibaculum sp.]
MIDLTYRGVPHHGEGKSAQSGDAVLNYRGASHHTALTHKDKPRASRADLRYRGVPQHD